MGETFSEWALSLCMTSHIDGSYSLRYHVQIANCCRLNNGRLSL